MDNQQAPVQFMSHHTAVEYKIPEPSLLSIHFAQELAKARIIGHRCPQCSKVYMPPRGYCPLCVVETTEADEVEVAPRGTVTTFSIITPLQYQGQEEHDDYVQGTILLDGADTTIMVVRMDGIPLADMRMGMRVQVIWPPEAERSVSASSSGARAMGLGDAVAGWEPTGEPDLTREQIAEHIL
jgi:uncharacterized OB-fold protein